MFIKLFFNYCSQIAIRGRTLIGNKRSHTGAILGTSIRPVENNKFDEKSSKDDSQGHSIAKRFKGKVAKFMSQ